jgi:membrane-bound lytic murein transglycosylase D
MRFSPWIGRLFLSALAFPLFAWPGNVFPAPSTPSPSAFPAVAADWAEARVPSYLQSKDSDERALNRDEAFFSEPVNDLPPVIRPPQEEIRKKVILEWKELQKGLPPEAEAAYDIPIVINDQVEYFLDYFQTKIRKRFSLWLSRSTRYIPLIKKTMNQYGLPEDLVYLAMIESGFSNIAYSRAQAVGMWQFIRETGQRYGLKINPWVDERKDPIKATQAAARYLSDLYKQFGSWYLAAAGYNAGEGKIARALVMYNAQNYWEITADHCRYIKDETKQYVPKMIAAALIAKEPEKYGFTDIPYYPPMAFEEVSLPGAVELKDVAAAAGTDLTALVDLNPELKRWMTPPNGGEYLLRIPAGSKNRLLENYAQLIKPKPRPVYAQHKVKKGELFTSIARRYGLSAGTIAKINRIKLTAYPKPGTLLMIPAKGSLEEISAQEEGPEVRNVSAKVQRPAGRHDARARVKPEDREQQPEVQRLQYRIKKGDSLTAIAQQHVVTIEQIRKWNPRLNGKIQVGRTLTLYGAKEAGEEKVKTEKGKGNKSPRRKSWIAAEQGLKVPPPKRTGRQATREVASGFRNLD